MNSRARRRLLAGACVAAAGLWLLGSAAPAATARLDADPGTDLWLAPTAPVTPVPFADAVADLNAGQPARALPVLSRAVDDPEFGAYALLYLGRAQVALDHWSDAAATAQQLLAREPSGYLGDAALWLASDADENLGDWAADVEALRALTTSRPVAPERVWLRLAEAAEHTGDRHLAAVAYAKVYYDYPLTPEADEAAAGVARLPSPIGRTDAERRRLDAGRAEQLFDAHRYSDARKAFDALRAGATGDERARITLRLAECDVALKRYTTARDALRPLTTGSSPLRGEATVDYANVLRLTGHGDDYVAYVRKFADSQADAASIEQALNDLATYDIVHDDDAAAAAVFTEMDRRFPTGQYAERAAWRAGWWSYRHADFGDAIRIFESAVASLGRVDRRPSYMYWAARAHAQRGERDVAADGYRQVIADYRNSYYGRLAARDLDALAASDPEGGPNLSAASPRTGTPARFPASPLPPNAALIRRLLAVGLYDAAIGELRKVQATSGSSPLIEATVAYAQNRKGDLRTAITTMRHAYPQFIADGGEQLPAGMLAVIFPVNYWGLISEQAAARLLDPYLMAALVAQESTFDASARSAANAYGLMQILPATGRRYAPELGVRPFSTSRLTDPSVNVRIGMAYFADLVQRFGDPTLALAAYNAGEERVAKWVSERPGTGRDEFIDDIPYPETQNYVKRIVGTAEDYRALYKLP